MATRVDSPVAKRKQLKPRLESASLTSILLDSAQTIEHLAELYAQKDSVAGVNIPLDVIK